MNHPQSISELTHKVALFFSQNILRFGYVKETANGKALLIDTEDIGTMLSPARIILLSDTKKASSPEQLYSFKEQVLKISEGFEPISLQGESFAEICDKMQINQDDQRFALFLYLKAHPETYYQKHERFYQRSPEECLAYEQARTEAHMRYLYLESVARFIAGSTAEDAELSDEDSLQLRQELRDILQGIHHDDLEKLIAGSKLGKDIEQSAISLRERLGDYAGDPVLMVSGLPIAFDRQIPEAPEMLSQLPHAELHAFSIDDEDTLDYDDAISLQSIDDHYRLGIHVSNPSRCLHPDHPLFQEALSRVSSLYLPSLNVPMLPPLYSSDVFSLRQSGERNVLSLYLSLDSELNAKAWELKSESIRISENLSYHEVDHDSINPVYKLLHRISNRIREQRDAPRDQDRYYYNLKVVDGRVQMKRIDTLSPARMMIEELMITYNRSIATYAKINQIPLLYRNISQFVDQNQAVRSSSAYLSTQASYHPGIGAEAYLHATSPIRRVVDLINQMQVSRRLSGQDVAFSSEELTALIPSIEKRVLLIRDTVNRSDRYWFLKYIEQDKLHTPLEAILKGYVNGKLKAEILPWRKLVLLDTAAKPDDEYFHFVVYAVDWLKHCLKVDIIG